MISDETLLSNSRKNASNSGKLNVRKSRKKITIFRKIFFHGNTCAVSGYIPKCWLKIKVVYIPKPGKLLNSPKSFRPISLMSFILKSLEHIFCLHLEDKILELKNQQYAYRKNRSTIQALNDMITKIEEKLMRKIPVWSAFLDISGAFDKLQFETVRNALVKRNIEHEIVNWIMSFLSFREITSQFHSFQSSLCPLNGVPQGSVLACRLWIICVDDLIIELEKIPGLFIVIYSDDCHMQTAEMNEEDSQSKLGQALEIIDKWCDTNGLEINRNKCEFVRFTKKHKLLTPTLQFKGETIEFTNRVKYLGLLIDSKLSWELNLSEIENKIRTYLFMVKGLAGNTWCVNLYISKMLYESVILPKVFYGASLWYFRMTTKYFPQRLQRLHNKALRILCPSFPNSPAMAIEAAMGMLPIDLTLKKCVTIEIARLYSINQWDIYSNKRHYAANNMIQIRHRISNGFDTIISSRNLNFAESIIPSRVHWLENQVHIPNDHILIATDASVDIKNSRTGIGIFCHELGLNIAQSTKQIMSSYKAENYALFVALEEILNANVSDKKFAFLIDNLSVVKKVTDKLCSSRLVKRIQEKIFILENRRHKITIYWYHRIRTDVY